MLLLSGLLSLEGDPARERTLASHRRDADIDRLRAHPSFAQLFARN